MFFRARVCAGGRCRTFSTAHLKYPSKVRAFPFALSPDEAIIHLGPLASMACFFKGFLGSVGARILGLGFTPIQPTKIQAVYLPTWFIDAELEASAWVTPSDGSEPSLRVVNAAFVHSYMPGFSLEPLSRLSFNNKALHRLEHVPFSEQLEEQHGTSVLSMPYTISPLSLHESARALSYGQATISNDLRFLPNSTKLNFLAAYPVLIPIYLARYDVEVLDEKLSVNLILEAFSNTGRIFCELGHFSPWTSGDLGIVEWRGEGKGTTFANVYRLMAPTHQQQLAAKVREWINSKIIQPHALRSLSDINSVDMKDPRVRELSKEETRWNRRYIKIGTDLLAVKAMIEKVRDFGGMVFQINAGQPPIADSQTAKSSFEKSVAALEKERLELKPQWWTDWQSKT